MKLKNRVLSFLLVVCMLATLLPVSAMAVGTAQTTEQNTMDSRNGELLTDAPQEEAESFTDEELQAALEANRPEQAEPAGVTVEEVENPGVDLKQTRNENQTVETAPFDEDETVSVIVVLEDKGLLEQGFTTAQIASANARVERQVETLAKRQENVLQSINRVVDEPVEAKYHYSVALNGMAVEIPYGDLEAIRNLPGVKTAFVAPRYDIPEDMTGETADPYTYATKDVVGSVKTWETLGYTGQGMRIAIIDSGLDTDHPAFAEAPELTDTSLTLSEVEEVMTSLNAYKIYMEHSAVALTADRLYRSEKVPFGFNYCDDNLELNHDNPSAYDHGSHVAGIAAANPVEGTEVVGVAPDAQILVMKVFGINGGASTDDIIAALEDCYRLNVDAINLSLGTPAGFTNEAAYLNEVYGRILESDMIAAISAGNSYSAAYMNGLGTDRNFTSDPDIGVMSSPATYAGGTVVASVENGYLMCNYFTAYDEKIPFTDNAEYPFTGLAGETLTYVLVPGYGTAEDFAKVDVQGKIAVVSRGELAYVDKQRNAHDAGAVAMIVYDNTDSALSYMQDARVLPNIFISKASGQFLIDHAENGEGTLTVLGKDAQMPAGSSLAGQMSDFSSWGVTPDLQLMPDITAPGGNIYSVVNGGGYGTKSGTSMAAPHITGMSALVLEYMREKYDLYDDDAHTIAEALLMSTAQPVVEPTGVEYSPRKQGSGLANVYDAIVSPTYLTVGGSTPKVSMGDDDSRTGVYRFSFEVNNLSDEVQTYLLDSSVLTDEVDLSYADMGYYFMGESSRKLDAKVTFALKNSVLPTQYDYNVDGETDLRDVQALLDAVNGLSEIKAGYDLSGDGKTNTADAQALYEMIQKGFTAQNVVNVPAGGSVRIYATVTLSDADKAYMDRYYENGIYVDGFVRLYAQNENAVDLSLPFMGFYGDWSDAPIFDSGWYYEEAPIINRYRNVVFTNFGGSYYGLGDNPYVEEPYDSYNNVLSPNGDGYQDTVAEMYLSMMRNAREMKFTWVNKDTGEVVYRATADHVRKSYYFSALNVCIPMIVSEWVELFNFKGQPNGAQFELTVDAWLDDGDNLADDTVTVPVTIDTEAPVLYAEDIDYVYDANTDTRKINFYVSDNHGIAAVAVLTEAAQPYEIFGVDDVPGEKTLISVDVSDCDSTFYLAVCDYACNEVYYKITFTGESNLDMDSFFGYRTYSAYLNSGYLFGTAAYNGWYSFETADKMLQHTSQAMSGEAAVYAAEYVDGYILGVDSASNIFAMKAGDWNRMPLNTLEVEGETYPALDMAFDYTTGNLYILTDELEEGTGQYLVKLDYRTGETAVVAKVSGIDSFSGVGLVLACDNEGVLYTIDYSTGALYTVNKDTAAATYVGETGYKPYFQQSMTVDHATDKLYWAAYKGFNQEDAFFEVNKETGVLTKVADIQSHGEMAGVFKPHHPEKSLYPETALEALTLSKTELGLCVGGSATVLYIPQPYYAQMEDVVWTSSDESVATVFNGVVTGVGVGSATVTATSGDRSVTCQVEVSTYTGDMLVYDNVQLRWVEFNASAPQDAERMNIPNPITYGIRGAAYWNGSIYACNNGGKIYRMDPETMDGILLGSANGPLYGMGFNYSDAFLYGLERFLNDYYLVRVNTNTGASQRVMKMNDVIGGQPVGGMTIDYEGNFYMLSANTTTGLLEVVKFRLENDQAVELQSAVLEGYPVPPRFFSVVYSPSNDGLLCAYESKLLYLDVADLDNLQVVELGTIANVTNSADMSSPTALMEILETEPETHYAEVTDVTLDREVYDILEGNSMRVNVEILPWNAPTQVSYSVKDPSIATVDSNGLITALKAGETTLGIKVVGIDKPLEAKIVVAEATGYIYGCLLDNFVFQLQYPEWFKIMPSRPYDSYANLAYSFDYIPQAGAYYDGCIYACAKSRTSGDMMWYMVKIDLADYSVERLQQVHSYVRDMEFDYATGAMFAIMSTEDSNGILAQMDLTTGEMVPVGDTGLELCALTVDAEGKVYTISRDGNLYTLDKATAEPTLVGSTGAKGSALIQSMHYDRNSGKTFWAQTAGDKYFRSGSLYMVDLETGKATDLGKMGGSGAQMSCMYVVPDVVPEIPETVEAMGVSLEKKNVVAVGESLTLNARVLPVSLAKVDETLTWTSSDESVATVKDGVVTGKSAGTVTITATVPNGQSDTCQIIVTENVRKFYAYDRTNGQWISFSGDDTANVTVERKDALGESRIFASAWTGEHLYAYDLDGNFYDVDPDTFVRTKVGTAAFGSETMDIYGRICKFMPTDMSYDEAAGKLYVLLTIYYENTAPNAAVPYVGRGTRICEVDVATGETTTLFENQTVIPANLLVRNGVACFVDSFQIGVLKYLDLYGSQTISAPFLVHGYWGCFFDGASFIEDSYTDTIYAIRDLSSTGNAKHTPSTLGILHMGDAEFEELGIIGDDIVVNSLFIR